ncbi:Subtilase family protein [Sphingobium sp. AP50]|uniref:S8 family peptidase n=1 Tax=Sphingobium sp. AP50 TaxID=1884369 RepID=UPI0008D6F8A6|nr:S8 family peptidase [Sphingobium sp. AP50]SEK00161.1 Subtilase family protein [Sphingobium sp. AP50]
MPSPFDRSHLNIDAFATAKPYQRPNQGPRDGVQRATEQHAENLKRQLATAWADMTSLVSSRDGSPAGNAGTYLDFETLPYQPLPDLTWATQGIRLATADRKSDGTARGTLFVPDTARTFLKEKLDEYRDRRGARQRPAHESRFAAIERLFASRLTSLWVDRRPLPASDVLTWWECWCWPDRVDHLVAKAEATGATVAQGRLSFAEREVLFLFTDRAMMARIAASCDAVAELRLGRDDASFFTSGEGRDDQNDWIASVAERLDHAEDADAVAVCMLDTGVNRAHPLLAPVFATDDLHSVKPAWGVDDHHGHGSEMAGLALFGDLTAILPSTDAITIPFVGESVKLLAPHGFEATEPGSYGLVTRQAIYRAELSRATRERIFCMAVTQRDVYGPRATSWSASLDVLAFGGEELDDLRPRLICVSAGNLPDGLKHGALEDWDSYEVEDPAHAWNILTAGGYTQKGPISDEGFEHWPCAAEIGTLSPYSRVSATWNRGVSAIKPELVLEAGNKGIDGDDLVSGIDSLSLLTTSSNSVAKPLTLAWATSAATAQLAGMAARILADDPALWPETIRALLVSSARWTPQMDKSLFARPGKTERLAMLRRFGYGVPSIERALRSRSSTVALIGQAEIQPFVRKKGETSRVNEAHFYELPWPTEALLALGDKQVRLRVVLSYFIEPNPSADAPLSPARYRSAGLRFDLCRRNEGPQQFETRVNALASLDDDDDTMPIVAEQDDPGRVLGVKSISAGSLHVEEWRCNAADLADRNVLAVFPVGGWWKSTKDRDRNNGSMAYSLVVTIDGGDIEQDLWIEINQQIEAQTEVDIETR